MTVSLAAARRELERMTEANLLRLFAQAHAQRVLLEVDESPENFPSFDEDLDDRVTWAAYAIIAAACTLAERGARDEAKLSFHRGAELLEHVHRTRATEPASAFHVLIAAMSFYAAGQYSRAFVSIRATELHLPTARLLAALLKRDVAAALAVATEIIASALDVSEDFEPDVDFAVSVATARAVHLTLEYAHSGVRPLLDAALECVDDASAFARDASYPSGWLIARLLRLILGELGDVSLWHQLPIYFPSGGAAALDRYTRLHALSRRPAWEIWQSQRQALPHALSATNQGAVVNLRTSGGKTRVAELAILQCLVAQPDAKVLYLAPFRSLALEIEQALNATLGALGFSVSHLYGGSRVSSADTRAMAEGAITIATPEKARALARATPDILASIKLIVIDEGHLLGAQPRLVRNEIFIDHLRAVASYTGARILLLSAVLPNAAQVAHWVSGDAANLAQSNWKPSAERLGLLLWNRSRVRIEWRGDVASFNPRFVERSVIPGTRRHFPKTKAEAVAASAVRLSTAGPVMIFSARVVSIGGLARAALTATELAGLPPHSWETHEWRVFEAVCREDLPPDALELEAARQGIVCHHAQLPPQVRLALEHLMRATPPRIIIATMTLAQGVNVGISSVIVYSVSPSKDAVSKRDFWNICGRAGRAFVDGEGRILYAIDEKDSQARKQRHLAAEYFEGPDRDHAVSGLYQLVAGIRRLARDAGVDFERLLELVAENDLDDLDDARVELEGELDLVDDELLAIHGDSHANPDEQPPEQWVEIVFRRSLAALQAQRSLSADDLLRFLAARTRGVLKLTADPTVRRGVMASGLPVRAAVEVHATLELFRGVAEDVRRERTLEAAATALRTIETWLRDAGLSTVGKVPNETTLDRLRKGWLSGMGIRQLCTEDGDLDVLTTFYGMNLPWVLNAAAQQLRAAGDECADTIDLLALLTELGVPTENAALVFLAGIRSRVAAVELAAYAEDFAFGATVPAVGRRLRDDNVVAGLREIVTPETAEWLELLRSFFQRQRSTPVQVPEFELAEDVGDCAVLHVRTSARAAFLCSDDLRVMVRLDSRLPEQLLAIANDPRYTILRQGSDSWRVVTRDPRFETTI